MGNLGYSVKQRFQYRLRLQEKGIIRASCAPSHTRGTRAVVSLIGTCAVCFGGAVASAETPLSVIMEDIDSGTTSPAGHYRWMDTADQLYDVDDSDGYSYEEDYDYTQATVQVDFFTDTATLHGTLTAANLKPNFVYQFKLVSIPGTSSNERIGLTGRWWQEQWNGSEWSNGQNLNNKGDGSAPNPNDLVYYSRRDIPDPTSPTGLAYRYTPYLVFDYFITDESGNASVSFDADSSYHVLWKTSQRTHTADDGPLVTATFTGGDPDPVSAYDTVYPEATVSIFGEWERLPCGGVRLPPGGYEGHLMLTEESFHGSGMAGGWAAAVGAAVSFQLLPQSVPTMSLWGLVVMALLVASVAALIWPGVVLRVPGRSTQTDEPR